MRAEWNVFFFSIFSDICGASAVSDGHDDETVRPRSSRYPVASSSGFFLSDFSSPAVPVETVSFSKADLSGTFSPASGTFLTYSGTEMVLQFVFSRKW
jgi:hypothetical protein